MRTRSLTLEQAIKTATDLVHNQGGCEGRFCPTCPIYLDPKHDGDHCYSAIPYPLHLRSIEDKCPERDQIRYLYFVDFLRKHGAVI